MASSLYFITKILRFWREILIVSLAGICYYIYSQPGIVCPPPVTLTDTKYITKREKVHTRVTEPDGRIVEKTVEHSDEAATITKNEVPKPVPKSKWSVGASYDIAAKGYQGDVGYRLGQSPISVTGGYRYPDNSVLVGVRVDW